MTFGQLEIFAAIVEDAGLYNCCLAARYQPACRLPCAQKP